MGCAFTDTILLALGGARLFGPCAVGWTLRSCLRGVGVRLCSHYGDLKSRSIRVSKKSHCEPAIPFSSSEAPWIKISQPVRSLILSTLRGDWHLAPKVAGDLDKMSFDQSPCCLGLMGLGPFPLKTPHQASKALWTTNSPIEFIGLRSVARAGVHKYGICEEYFNLYHSNDVHKKTKKN